MSDAKTDYSSISSELAAIQNADMARRTANRNKRRGGFLKEEGAEHTFDTGLKGHAIRVIRPKESGFEMIGKGAADAMTYSRPRRPENVRDEESI